MTPLPGILAVALLLAPAYGTPHGEDPLPPADPAVTREALEHHVRFLASDDLLGRAAGTPESLRASAYLARALERAGVEPAGEPVGEPGGEAATYFQELPLLRTVHRATPELALAEREGGRRLLIYGDDFTVDVEGDPRSTGTLGVRVVRAPQDLPGEPDPDLALVVAASRSRGLRWLEERGWKGGAGFGLVIRARPDKLGRPRRAPSDRLERAWLAEADGPEVVTVDGPWAARLWDGEVATVELTLHAAREPVAERNVVGLVRGVGTAERPELAREVLVLSAHFDHIGVRRGADPATAEEDVINNGADDDASGSAVLLELAEALAGGERPARTVLFLFCAARRARDVGYDLVRRPPHRPGGGHRL